MCRTAKSIILVGLILIFAAGFIFGNPHRSTPLESREIPLIVYQGVYRGDAAEVAEFKTALSLDAGNYSAVLQGLKGYPLTERGLFVLNRARLALGLNPLGLLAGEGFPLLEGARGFYLANLGYLQGAEEVLQKSLAMVKTDRETLELGLAAVLIRQGRQAEADRLLLAVRTRNPESSGLKVLEGDLALSRGDMESAYQLYSQAKETGHLKQDPVFETKLGLTGIGTGREVKRIVEELKSLEPYSGLADYLEAQNALHTGDLTGARKSLESALAKPLPPPIVPSASSLAQELESRVNAEAALQAVISSSP